MAPKLDINLRLRLITRAINGEKINQICQETGISRTIFYRWLKRFKDRGVAGLEVKSRVYKKSRGGVRRVKPYPKLNESDRLRLVSEVIKENQPIGTVSQRHGVSKVTIYKWLKRYRQAGESQKALSSRVRVVEHFFRETPAVYQQAILNLAANHPEYGVRRLVANLPKIGTRPIVGHHGVQNILKRQGLLSFKERLIYSQNKKTRLVGLIERILAVVVNLLTLPAESRQRIIRLGLITLGSAGLTVGAYGLIGLSGQTLLLATGTQRVGLVMAITALSMGLIFFLYSLKYYLTIAIVLSFSQREGEGEKQGSVMSWLLGQSQVKDNLGRLGPVGLEPDLSSINLDHRPFVSVQIPFYNEKNVAKRAIEAAISFNYPAYEVMILDDSTDETTDLVKVLQQELCQGKKIEWRRGRGWEMGTVEIRPGLVLKHLHRISRDGYKGGALAQAAKLMDKRTEFVSVFDADFVPYPDSLELFLKYFKMQNDMKEDYTQSQIAAVQGYQWHVLNKSENWITRGVRSEYAGSYVIERAGAEIYGGLKQISGSVYMIRRDVLDKVGWGKSITEDFELTLRLYAQGFKVVYTPYIQAPAECVSTLKRLIRQRMRWAEGHSQGIKRMFVKLLANPKLTTVEKLEFTYLSPYYLQAFFFLVGTLCWLISETVFPARLPFWTVLWGWSLVLTNMIALPLMNAVGLFLEESEERDYLGLASFVALSYILVPFQAYAAVKGFVEKEEGPWFRTPKTGLITDVFTRGKFYRLFQGILPGSQPVYPAVVSPYLALTTANNQFNSFSIRPRHWRWMSKMVLVGLLVLTVTLYSATRGVPEVFATDIAETQYLANDTTATLTNAWKLLSTVDTQDTSTTLAVNKNILGSFKYYPGTARTSLVAGETKCGTSDGRGWLLDTPFQADGSIAAGAWTFNIYESDADTGVVGHLDVCVFKVTVSGGTIQTSSLLFETEGDSAWATTDVWDGANTLFTDSTSNQLSFSFAANEYLYIEYWNTITTKIASVMNSSFYTGENGATDPSVVIPTITIPENSMVLLALVPFIPGIVLWLNKRKSF